MARYWLYAENQYDNLNSTIERITRFAWDNRLEAGQTTLGNVSAQLDGNEIKGDPDAWVVFLCFWHHPSVLWDFMMAAFEAAETDDHYQKIATNLAEHLLAHYGSAIPNVEKLAQQNDDFARMLTGAWRHRMSDDVWARLRLIQARVPNPLPSMIPVEKGINYMSDSLSEFDRKNANKGRYLPDQNGVWRPRSELKDLDAGCD